MGAGYSSGYAATGSFGLSIDSSEIADDTIVNADINTAAEILVSKFADGSARQLLQTDSAGTGVEWTSNVDIPGTLDVTGATTLDSTLGVAAAITDTVNAVGTAQTAGTTIRNTTAAAAGAQQYSPMLVMTGQGWKTDATAASQQVDFAWQVRPVEGAAAPTAVLDLRSRIDAGAWGTASLRVNSAGEVSIGGVAAVSGQNLTVSGNIYNYGQLIQEGILYLVASGQTSIDGDATTLTVTTGSATTFTATATAMTVSVPATFSGAANRVTATNTSDAASVQVAIWEGDRATMTDADEAYFTFRLSNDAGAQTEVARLTWVATDVNAATSVDGRIDFAVMTAGTLADELQLDGTALSPSANDGIALGTSSLGYSDVFLASGAVVDLGAGDVTLTHASNALTLAGGDFFVADGNGVILGHTAQITAGAAAELQVLGSALADSSMILGAFSADAVGPSHMFVKSRHATVGSNTIVQDNDVCGRFDWYPADGSAFTTLAATFFAEVDDASPAAGDIGMAFVWRAMRGAGSSIADVMRLSADGALSPGVSDGTALGTTSLMWADAFFASGAVLNFNAGDFLLTHSSDTLTWSGGALRGAASVNLLINNATVGSGGAGVIAMANGPTAPSASVDLVHIYAEDRAAGAACLAIYQEDAPSISVATASTHKVGVRINGSTYYFLLSNV